MSTERVPNLCLRCGFVLSGKRPRPSLGAFAAAFPPAVLLTRPPGAARLSLRLIERLDLVAMRGRAAGSRCDREARHAVSQAAFASSTGIAVSEPTRCAVGQDRRPCGS
jgi:hypothetical protein